MTSLPSVVSSLLTLAGKDSSRSSPVRCSSYTFSPIPSVAVPITSFIFQESAFKRRDLPIKARGLFVQNIESPDRCRIAVRGYDKFFNVPVNETPETHWDAMERNLRGPFEVTLKENGCIIFVSALEGHLIVTSKHAVGSDTVNGSLTHAQKGEEWLLKHLKDAGRSRLDLAKHLESHNVTAVFELVDDDFEEHILSYPPEKSGLRLHGVNQNTIEFSTWGSDQVRMFGKDFGIPNVDGLRFETLQEVKELMDQCSPSGSYKGEPVEGFVIRSQTHANQTFFFKVKFDEPYLMFREFREATRSILSGNHKFTPKYQLTFKYMAWVHRKKRQDPTFFQDFLKNKGIIRARNAFLIEEDLGTGFERLVELAKETVDSSAYPDSSMQKEKENVFFKSPFGTQGKLLILPIAIIGAGKTTLARVLSKICPVKFRHIQSDNMPAKKKAAYFTETIVDAFKECDVVYADKNNHLFQHRSAVIREFKATHASGLAVVLDWKAEKLNRQSVLDHCHKRILLRGENHQTLTPSLTPQFPGIIRNFLTKRDPVDLTNPSDMLIDLVVSMNLFSEVKANVIHVCQTFKWSIPSDDVLDALITDALNVKLESPKSTPSKARIAYYGIDLTGWDAVSFMESVSQKFPAQVKNLSPVLKSRLSERNEHHITLAARFAHPDLFSEIHTSYQEVKQRRLQDEQDWKRALKRRPTSRGGVSPSFTSENQIIQGIRFGNVVWDDQTLVVTVHLPSHIRCGNPVAHITLATRSDDVLPAYSNTLLHVYKVVGAQDGVHSVDVSGYEIQGTLRHFA